LLIKRMKLSNNKVLNLWRGYSGKF
jgi:hypothetical protein